MHGIRHRIGCVAFLQSIILCSLIASSLHPAQAQVVPTLTLDSLPYQIAVNDEVQFRGTLRSASDNRPIYDGAITIYGFDGYKYIELAKATTDRDGNYQTRWKAQSAPTSLLIYAYFASTPSIYQASSQSYFVQIVQESGTQQYGNNGNSINNSQDDSTQQKTPTFLYLNPPSSVLTIGQTATFTGSFLTLYTQEPLQNARINIYGYVYTDKPVLLASTMTDANGRFSGSWTVQNLANSIGIFANFGGDNSRFAESRSQSYFVALTQNISTLPSQSTQRYGDNAGNYGRNDGTGNLGTDLSPNYLSQGCGVGLKCFTGKFSNPSNGIEITFPNDWQGTDWTPYDKPEQPIHTLAIAAAGTPLGGQASIMLSIMNKENAKIPQPSSGGNIAQSGVACSGDPVKRTNVNGMTATVAEGNCFGYSDLPISSSYTKEYWIEAGNNVVMAMFSADSQVSYKKYVADFENSLKTLKVAGATNGGGGGCLIATAAFGSELTPQVQFLRGFRDNHILSTSSGSSFMNVFNAWYYSFSPYVADYERGQPWLQLAVKSLTYPLLGILQLSEKAYTFIPGELGAISAGAVASSLIGVVYFAPVAMSIKRVRQMKIPTKVAIAVPSLLAISIIASVATNNVLAMMISTTLFVLSTLSIAAVLSAKAISQIARRIRISRSTTISGQLDCS